MAQPFGGIEHLLAGLLDLSNLPLEINVSSRAYIDVQVQVSRNGTLINGGSFPRRRHLNSMQVTDPGELTRRCVSFRPRNSSEYFSLYLSSSCFSSIARLSLLRPTDIRGKSAGAISGLNAHDATRSRQGGIMATYFIVGAVGQCPACADHRFSGPATLAPETSVTCHKCGHACTKKTAIETALASAQ
jgi:hypothetical protein